MKGRCVVVSAAEIESYKKIRTLLNEDDYFIVCDGGLNHCKPLGIVPDMIVGDFDSFDKDKIELATGDRPLKTPKIIALPREKDDTDTFYAVKEALKLGFTEFLLLGVIGQRFDHSLVNISVLLYLKDQGASGIIIDDYSEMKLVGVNPVTVSSDCAYFSLMCVAGDVSGVTVRGAKWNLENAEIKTSYQYGISNEVVDKKGAVVSVENGTLLLVKVF